MLGISFKKMDINPLDLNYLKLMKLFTLENSLNNYLKITFPFSQAGKHPDRQQWTPVPRGLRTLQTWDGRRPIDE